MAWQAPRTWAALDKVRLHWLNQELRDNMLILRGLNGLGVQVTTDEDKPIPSAETVPVPWDSALWQLGSLWTSGTDITIPTTGYYLVKLILAFDADTGGSRKIGYQVSGQKVYRSSVTAVTDNDSTVLNFSDTVLLTAGDVLQFLAQQTSGQELRLFHGTDATSQVRGVVRLVGTV